MSYSSEFQTIELLEKSQAETRAVDAFALALIKAERQLRKLFTFLIFQNSAFDRESVAELRNTLAKKKAIYFEGFLRGFNEISPVPVDQLVGADYTDLRKALDEAIAIRNKVFHGQVTDQSLSREDLFHYVNQIRKWCQLLANTATKEIGYDGFGRNSYRKAATRLRLRCTFSNFAEYGVFWDRVLSRPRKK